MSKAPSESAPTPESDVFESAPHPRTATRLVGHGVAEAEMLNAYRERRLAHAWLIAGREGIGKATLAWRFARFVLVHPDPAAPAVRDALDLSTPADHPAARQLAAMAHPDFALLRREWNPKTKSFFTEIRVDDVRAHLGVFHMSAGFGGWRVAIVDSADDLNRAGANALLKMIEEPPPRSLILIVAHRPGQLPPTIRSRCRRLLLGPLAAGEIGEIVKGLGPPWSAAGAEDIAAAASRADGSVRETMRRLDPAGQGLGALIDATLAQLPRADRRAVHKLAEAVSGRAAGDAFERLTVGLYDWLAARCREPSSPARLEAIAALWERLRAATRETEALNLDKKLHVLAVFEEIAARGRVL
jgi:DNA polymerase-3 subunit delta'